MRSSTTRLAYCAAAVVLAAGIAADRQLRAEAARHAGAPLLDYARIYAFDAGFEEPLAWDENEPPTKRIPRRVAALDGKEFALEGYMQALEFDPEGGELVTQFVLTPNPVGCCTGHYPLLQEQIMVTMDGPGTELRSFGTCVVEGRFRIDPVIDDEGDVLVLFQMEGQRVRGRK